MKRSILVAVAASVGCAQVPILPATSAGTACHRECIQVKATQEGIFKIPGWGWLIPGGILAVTGLAELSSAGAGAAASSATGSAAPAQTGVAASTVIGIVGGVAALASLPIIEVVNTHNRYAECMMACDGAVLPVPDQPSETPLLSPGHARQAAPPAPAD